MLELRNRLAMHHWTRLGRCPYCIRTAFLFAFGSIAVAVAATFALPSGWPLFGVWLAAAAFTALWLGHVYMFSHYATRALAIRRGGEATVDRSRRAILLNFLKLLLVTATVTSLPRTLSAQACNCYTEGNCYCPPEFPQCIYNPTTGESICCGPSTVGCAGPTMTWCCPPGSQCYGTSQCWSPN
jgi:hypothetical protein